MKIINPNAHALVILNWDEYRDLLTALPEKELIRILAEVGCKPHDLRELTKEALISKIYCEYEVQAY
jgi:hypothetical protein